MIPETELTTSQWNTTNTTSGGYLNSYIHTTTLPTVANKLKKVLGTHLINRRVLLSSAISGNDANVVYAYASAYTWTNAYCTLMSIGQMTGNFSQNNNKYDDGEANYKLPLFNFMGYKTGSDFWSRGIGISSGAWFVGGGGGISGNAHASHDFGVRPLIYIR